MEVADYFIVVTNLAALPVWWFLFTHSRKFELNLLVVTNLFSIAYHTVDGIENHQHTSMGDLLHNMDYLASELVVAMMITHFFYFEHPNVRLHVLLIFTWGECLMVFADAFYPDPWGVYSFCWFFILLIPYSRYGRFPRGDINKQPFLLAVGCTLVEVVVFLNIVPGWNFAIEHCFHHILVYLCLYLYFYSDNRLNVKSNAIVSNDCPTREGKEISIDLPKR